MKTTLSKIISGIFLIAATMLPNFANSQAAAGYLYGVTWSGGQNGNGTVFRYDLSTATEQVVIEFDSSKGLYPMGNLVMDNASGLFFGSTYQGGSANDGVMFSYNPTTGTDSTIKEFNGLNGKHPQQGSPAEYNGYLYSMTNVGGTKGFGVLYRVNTATGKDSVMVDFDTANGKENSPMGSSLALYPANGLLYGMTYNGGCNKSGTLFCFNPKTGKDSVLVNLDTKKGTGPVEGALTLNKANSTFYGVTSMGGTYNNGVLFSYNPVTGRYEVLINFNVLNGSNPYGGLVADTANGLLYGMASAGGTYGDGVIYSFNPNTGTQNVLVNFNDTNGNGPTGSLTLGPNGRLYGETLWDATGNGLIFCYDPATATDSVLFTFNYTNGSEPYGSLLYVPAPSAIHPQLTSANTITKETKIDIYPNPGNGVFNIQLSVVSGQKSVVEVYNMLGEKVYSSSFNTQNSEFNIDLSSQPNGMYILKVQTKNGNTLVKRIEISR
jgi:uncharacterized repeat protein (TIGR03803 family)